MAQPDVGDVHTNMPIGEYADFDACVMAQVAAGHSKAEAKRICGAMEAQMTKLDMRILMKAKDKRFVLGVVYAPGSPDDTDTQGDFAKAETIEEAAWSYMQRLQKNAQALDTLLKAGLEAGADGVEFEIEEDTKKGQALDDQHLQVDEEVGVVVESYLAPVDFDIDGEAVTKGTWLIGAILSPKMWKLVKDGERTGFSLFGTATRVAA